MKYRCYICNGLFDAEDCCIPKNGYDSFLSKCQYCSHDTYFTNLAICHILNFWNLRYGEYSNELLEIEIIRTKIRWVLRGGETKYITYKQNDMITNVTNSQEMRQALNENLDALLTKKRKILVVKEVNNTLGKILSDVKLEMMQNALSGERNTISWFDRNITSAKQLPSGNGKMISGQKVAKRQRSVATN